MRLADLTARVSSGDATRVAAWFRRLGNHPDPTYQTSGAHGSDGKRHREHLVPVLVLTNRLLDGTLTPVQARAAVCIVDALAEENVNAIAKMRGKGGKQPIYKALLACPPTRLVEVASWRYISRGIRLRGLAGTPSIGLSERDRLESLVLRYAARYDRQFLG